jgi:hypothetical protein
MALRITKLNASGFTAPQDQAVDQTYINSAYEFVDHFSIDLKFEGEYEDDTNPLVPVFTYANAVNVTSTFNWSQFGITYSKPNAYTIRLTGPGINVFTNQYYKFKMADLSEQVFQPDTTLPFLSLIQYQMPSPTYTMKTYPISVTLPADPILGGSETTEIVNLNQWFYWRYEVALSNIAAANARGLR